jgi:hypothetical protein
MRKLCAYVASLFVGFCNGSGSLVVLCNGESPTPARAGLPMCPGGRPIRPDRYLNKSWCPRS